jgi:hypothetical protein
MKTAEHYLALWQNTLSPDEVPSPAQLAAIRRLLNEVLEDHEAQLDLVYDDCREDEE